MCHASFPAMPSAEEVCKNARRIAVLENVVNPTNVGAIFPVSGGIKHGCGAVDVCVQ